MMRVLLLSVFVLAAPVVAADESNEAVQKRLQPIGQVQVEGDIVAVEKTPDGQVQVQEEVVIVEDTNTQNNKPQKASAGKKVYDTYCGVCHAAGVAGAPKFRDKGTWGKRVKKPIADLVKSVQNGLNAMPPKGMCSNCTTEEFQAAILYMLPKK